VKPAGLLREAIIAAHEASLAEHGGPAGLRDAGLLDAALARPRQLLAYGDPPPDLAALAAAYAFGLVRNHPFVDGNKRTAFVAAELYLNLNGKALLAEDAACVTAILELAFGEIDEAVFARWLRVNLG
jgi:death-on-curing protein